MMKNRGIFLSFAVALLSAAVLSLSVRADSDKIPDRIQEYAETQALSNFKGIAGSLNLPSTVQISELTLGEGFPVYSVNHLEEAGSFAEALGDADLYYYVVEDGAHNPISSIQVYCGKNGELSSGGGAESEKLYRSVETMRRLIRKSGAEGDVKIVWYAWNYFVFCNFGGDERIIHVPAPAFFNDEYLKVSDYTELPTGQELLEELRKSEAEHKRIMEENGGQPVFGGLDLNLPLHRKKTSALTVVLISAGAIAVIAAVGLVVAKKQRNKRRREA